MLTRLLSSCTSTPCVLALLFPFSAHSPVLLCMETLLLSSDTCFFWYHFVRSMKDSIFLSKIIHLLHIWVKWTQVLVAAIWSYMVIDFILQNFCHSVGVTLKLCGSLCCSLCASKSQNLYYWFFCIFPTVVGKVYFPLTSILIWFSSFFLHSNNWMIILTLQVLWILQFSIS